MNEYDGVVFVSNADRAKDARYGYYEAMGVDPDAYAEALKTAKRVGVPVESVLSLPDDAKRQDRMQSIDFEGMASVSPSTAKILADMERAPLLHDNVESMTQIERKLRQFSGGAIEAVGMAVSGTGQLLEIAQRNALTGFANVFLPKPMAEGDVDMSSIVGPSIGKDWKTVGGGTKKIARNDVMIPPAEQTFADKVFAGTGQIVGQIAMLPIGRGAGIYAQGADVMAEKIAPDIASQGMKDLAVIGGAGITGLTEKWALDKILGPLAVPIKNKIAASAARIGVATITESGQEFTENTLQDVLRVITTNPNAKIDIGQSIEEAGVGAAVGGVVRSIVEAGLHIRRRGDAGIQQAEKSAELIAEVNRLASADKLLARSPETFEHFIESVTEDGPVQHIFIDANTLMQSGVAEQLAQVSQSVAEQLQEAVSIGGQIAIPVGEYAARIAPTEYAQPLIDHLKTEPEGFSRAEAKAYIEDSEAALEDEISRVLTENEGNEAFRASSENVRAGILSQLNAAGRNTERVNDAYASMVSNFYATNARKIGVTPEELFQSYPLNINAEMMDINGGVYERGALTSTSWETGSVDSVGQPQLPSGVDSSTKETPSPVSGLQQEQTYSQGSRGAFNPESLTISLLNNADLSTFLHESGHFFLEVQIDLANKIPLAESLTEGQRSLVKDTGAILEWFGVKDIAEWQALGIEEKRSYHEKFARGFEAYLFEGKSPNIEMQSLFQRFRSWLLSVYKDIKALNVDLTADVRQVFDRMLATDEEIALAEQGQSMMPLFLSPEQAGMSVEEFAEYQAIGQGATNEAIEALQAKGLRDMQWLHNARGREIQRLKKSAKAMREEVEESVRQEVMARPVHRARQFLTSKEGENGKFDLKALQEIGVSEDTLKYLRSRRMVSDGGIHPDVVGEIFGFTSGDELVKSLIASPSPKEEISTLTDARMLEEHGELSSLEAIALAADQAIHNRARARMVATEANALANATGQRRILASAAKAYAELMISRLKIRNIKPGQYTSAAARASKFSEKASRSGNLAVAAAEKRNQLIQHYAARSAYEAKEAVEKGLRYLKKFETRSKGLDVDYFEQIEALLERFDLRQSQSNKAVDKREALAGWLEKQRADGIEPDIPDSLKNEAFRTSYKNMTFEDFKGLIDTVKQFEHLGRLKQRLLTSASKRSYEAARDEIVTSIQENAQGRQGVVRTPTTKAGIALLRIKQGFAAHIKAATWARVIDGNKDGGPMWEYFIRGANAAGDKETTMIANATRALSEIMGPVFRMGKMGGKGKYFESVGTSLNRESRIAIALNTGNAGNMQRLLDGEGWTQAQLMPVLQSLTLQEWQAVQAVWDHFESYRPDIAAKERRVYGKEPEWVPPVPFSVTTAEGETISMRGGYYPIKYDTMASARSKENDDIEKAQRQLQGAYTSATTRRSYTKSRSEAVLGRPLLYTLSGMYSGVNEVIHDLSWHEWLIDTNRLLKSKTIGGLIRRHYGADLMEDFKRWVRDVAEGEKGAANAGEMILGRLRQGVSASGLGFNVMSAAIQITGFNQSIVRVGLPWIGRGVTKYLTNPLAATREVNRMSQFMENRSRTRFRELNELRNKVQDQNAVSEIIGRYSYFLMMRVQQIVDTPTWIGAYEKAISQGNEEARAIAMADQAVIDSQGGGQTKDLSEIERGSPALKIFTVFYSFMNTALNLGIAQTMGADTPAKKAKLAVDYLMLYTVPAVLGYAIKEALTPGDSGDDDLEAIADNLLKEQLGYLMGLFVFLREFSWLANIVTDSPIFAYQGPTGIRPIAEIGKFATQANQGDFDIAFLKSTVNLIGNFTGLPAAQINRSITGTNALIEGDTDNPAAIGFGFKKN